VARNRPPVATCSVRAAGTMCRYGRGLGATDSRWVARGGDRVSSRGTARCWALSLGVVVADGGIGSVSEREAVRASGWTKRVVVARLGLDSNVTVASARSKGWWSA